MKVALDLCDLPHQTHNPNHAKKKKKNMRQILIEGHSTKF